ncbi:MAG: FkbM family methyltransferase [Acetobacteraceae bacterium]|nr:FkbM family methyltransferase [Acetobacteraceae bacterium]
MDGVSGDIISEAKSLDQQFEYPDRSIVSYAQNREDVLLWRAFHRLETGFYIDVGAHDPEIISVTRAFYERGWSGVNIEPDPFFAEKLRRMRERDRTLQVALGRCPGKAVLFDFGDSGLSTTRPDIAIDTLVSGRQVGQRDVEVMTLSGILAEIAGQEVHFLKIDVEGGEADVLAGTTFDAVRPWIILVEALRPTTLEPTHQDWEPALLAQGYDYVYFDGLNRYYVAREHGELRRCFRVPVNIRDPFSDAAIQRLEHQLAQLRQHEPRQQAPRLTIASEVPIASATDDAAGLLRVVEAQATDLGRLRRALVAARSLAEQRLAMLRDLPARAQAAAPAVAAPHGSVPDPRMSAALADLQRELAQIQSDIADILQRSRWRRLGLRLGLARPAPWEGGAWAPDPALLAPNLASTLDHERRLRAEMARLWEHRADLGRSRWRKLGQRLGMAKRLPWETLVGPRMPEPRLPDALAQEAVVHQEAPPPEQPVQPTTDRASTAAPAATGYAAFLEHSTRSFLTECRRAAVDVILDVGANAGQFAEGLRYCGHIGHIVSFEPLSKAHAALAAKAKDDPLWSVVPRCAVGAAEGEATIHVAGNSYSSSLLPMLESHRSAAPESDYVDRETCPVVTLDAFIERTFSDATTRFGLKMDTQGFEAEVLRGLGQRRDQVEVILCEMSLTPLYAGAPTMFELCQQLAKLGYRCVALSPEFADPKTGLLLQVDGVFVRAPDQAGQAG